MATARISILCLSVAATLWACSAAAQDGTEDDDIVIDRTPERCISTSRLRNTRTVDNETILFYMRDDKIYQNVLPKECRNLKHSGQLTYGGTVQLCSTDLITGLDRFGGSLRRSPECRLGEFLPISELEANALLHGTDGGRDGDESGLDRFEVKPVESPDEKAEEKNAQ